MAPGSVFSTFWFFYSFIPLIFAFAVPVEPLAILYILAAMVAFAASTPFFNWRVAMAHCRNNAACTPVNYATKFMWVSFISCGVLAMVSLLVNSYIQKITVGDMISNFFGSSAQYVGRRYSGELQDNIFIKLSNLFSYLAASIGGLIYPSIRTKRGVFGILLVSFIPSAFVMVTQSARGMLFLAIAMFAAAYMIAMKGKRSTFVVSHKLISKTIGYGLIIVALISISFMAKGLHEEQDPFYVLDRLFAAFVSYTMGHLYAFCDWFSFYINRPSVNMYFVDSEGNGFFTFMALFKVFGSNREVAPGVYEEYYQYGSYIATNIYTIFRGLIIDYGILGSIVFMACLGLLANSVFFFMVRSRAPVASASFYVCAMGFYYTSFIISIMIWNSMFVVFAGFAFVLFVNRALNRRHWGLSSNPGPAGVRSGRGFSRH